MEQTTQLLNPQNLKLEEFQLARLKDLSTPGLSLTTTSRVILMASASAPLFRNLKGKESALRKSISKICAKVSIKAELSETEFLLIYDFVLRNYSMATLTEFEYAFELNLLNQDKETFAEHFNCFDCAYIGKVMGNYYKMKSDAIQRLKMSLPKELPKHESTDEDYYNRLLKVSKEKKEVPNYWNWTKVYEYMNSAGIVDESIEWKTRLKNRVIEQMRLDNEMQKLNEPDALGRARIDASFTPATVKANCHREYVRFKIHKLLNFDYLGIVLDVENKK